MSEIARPLYVVCPFLSKSLSGSVEALQVAILLENCCHVTAALLRLFFSSFHTLKTSCSSAVDASSSAAAAAAVSVVRATET